MLCVTVYDYKTRTETRKLTSNLLRRNIIIFSNEKYVPSNSESVQCNFFSFLITWRSSSSKSTAVYKISWKSDDFSLRYGDISIFKMAAVCHLGIVLPPYETTHHEVSVAGRSCHVKFHVNLIHRSEDIAIWIFRIFGLKCLFRPQNVVFWETLDP